MPEVPSQALEARGLGFRFPGGTWAFRDVDLALKSGETALLAGRNGAGKTMLAKNLAGLLKPTEGRILLGGKEQSTIKGSLARELGFVFQDARLQAIGETVLDDLLFGPNCLGMPAEEARARAGRALETCGLSGMEDRFVHELSGGELRRLAVAGTLVLEPKAMILDEPFANLDPEGVRAVLEILRSLNSRGTALLVVSHEIEKVLGLVSSFYVMDSGRIVLSGSPEEVLGRGIEGYGLRNPFRPASRVEDLLWL